MCFIFYKNVRASISGLPIATSSLNAAGLVAQFDRNCSHKRRARFRLFERHQYGRQVTLGAALRAASSLVGKEAALISGGRDGKGERGRWSLSRVQKRHFQRAAEPSKRAAIIDVPSLAPPRFSLPPRSSGGNQGQSSSPRLLTSSWLRAAGIFPRRGTVAFCNRPTR